MAGQGEASSSSAAVPSSEVSIVPAWEGVNESQPVTSLQLRLADGSRMVRTASMVMHASDAFRARPCIKLCPICLCYVYEHMDGTCMVASVRFSKHDCERYLMRGRGTSPRWW